EMADRYEKEVVLQLPLATEELEAATMLREALQRRLRGARPPTVTVLGGLPEKKEGEH
ncbi:MAG: hypothetical protein GY778_00145, partial [bacterium]|nr:hypothetical protein [bacterium]